MLSAPVRNVLTLIQTLAPLIVASCNSSDRRLAEYAEQARAQEARHNEQLVQQAQVVAETSRALVSASQELVEQDAAARRELVQAQGRVAEQQQSERTSIAAEQRALQEERRAAAQAARRDPVVAQAVTTGSLVLAALLPLLVALYALARIPLSDTSEELWNEQLLDTLIDYQSSLSCREDSPTPRLEATTRALMSRNDSDPATAGPTPA